MNREEHLLTRAMEECAELTQRLSKAQVFGMEEVQPDQLANPDLLNNRARIVAEFADLLGVMRMLNIPEFRVPESMIDAKIEKVEKYLAYSRAIGKLSE